MIRNLNWNGIAGVIALVAAVGLGAPAAQAQSDSSPSFSSWLASQPQTKSDAKTDEDKKKQAERDQKKAEADKTLNAGVSRVAILHFGPPREWQGEIDDTVGIQLNVKGWIDAIPLLEKDKVNVVVVKINSGGGMTLEVSKFHDVFTKMYKPRFRTVGWVESGISAAAMSPYVLDELYFMRNGSFGGAVQFSGGGNASKGVSLEMVLHRMEEASKVVDRDPLIARAMQMQQPLSCTIDPQTGKVHWFGDTTGEILVNPPGEVLTLNSEMAMKTKFAAGVADTKEELVKAMNLKEVVWAGQEATRLIDNNMRQSDRTQKKVEVVYREFSKNAEIASQAQDERVRAQFVGLARKNLAELRSMLSVNPNFGMMYEIDDNWFRDREEELRKLLRK